jgi:hypothetical protein
MTTVLFPADSAHLVQVVVHSACGYRAECLCGWASPWSGQLEARKARSEHREVTAGPYAWLDPALGRLLDLQDDLADAVFWMAEAWSADLPVPLLRFRSVPLDVRCDTRADLDRVARVLDAEFTAGRAVRCFGRVRIEAVSHGGRVG